MKLVQTLVVRDEADVVDAQLSYHLNAGVDFVLATDHESRDGTTEILESYEREGYLRLFREQGSMRESEWRTRMARLAASEYGADWIINTDADEFWMPRAESLHDVLAPIPPRYTVIQGLVRTFASAGGESFAESMTLRDVVLPSQDEREARLRRLLRPAFRADPKVVIGPEGVIGTRHFVPLRAWYPVEVLRFPRDQRLGERPAADTEDLVTDTRLRDVLRELVAAQPGACRFALPSERDASLVLPTPSVVDDAAYAIECAAVGEVDVEFLERQVDELERRIAALEAGFWPRVLRRLSRLGRS